MSSLGVDQQPQPRSDDRVVVDDQDADVHCTGTSTTSVVPASCADSIREPPVEQRDALAHPLEAEAPLARLDGSNPSPVVLDHATRRSRSSRSQDARHGSAWACLTMFVSDFLDDPVERRLDLGRERAARRGARSKSTGIPVLRSQVSVSRSSAATSPKSSSAFGRSSTASRRTSCSVARPRGREMRRRPRGARRRASVLLERAEAEQDRGERLPGLVVQLAREPPALELLRRDHARSASRATRSREVDGDRGARGERLGQAQVVVGEARRRAAELVVGREHPDRAVAHDQRHPEARAAAASRRVELAGRPRGRRAPSRRARSGAAVEHAPALATRAGVAVWPRSSSAAVARDRREAQLGRRLPGAARRPAGRRAARAAGVATSSSRRSSSRLGRERVPDLVQRLEPRRPARRRLVQARVLDRDRRLRGEQRHELLVLARELPPAGLLGQVEVAEGDAAQQDRHAEEGAHRRVMRREADRARVLPSGRGGAAGCASLDQGTPRMPRPWGSSPIAASRLGVDPVVTKRSSREPAGSMTPSAA